MSKTGHYVWDSEQRKFIKVSDRARLKSSVYLPRKVAHSGHFFENLDRRFYSKEEKRSYMKRKGIAEV